MSLIGRFEHLPNRPKSDEARPLLEKIASQVKPIMSKRGWKVGTLAEFLPSNPALLGNNMNAGQRINLRLRPPGDVTSFYEYDQLVLVMLHELTHIEHGPHDASFYKLLAVLEEEYYDLKRKGYSGEGFHGEGNHLSGFKVPEHVGRAKGLAAAQKRLEVQKKIGKGGVLGGSDYKNRSMKEVLAEAAERRMRDDKACQSQNAGHAKEVEEEVRKAQEESVGIDAVDIVHEPSDRDISSRNPVTDDGEAHRVTPAEQERESSPEIQIIDPPPTRIANSAIRSTGSAGSDASHTRKRKEPAPTGIAPKTVRPSPVSIAKRVPEKQSPTPTAGADEWSCPTCTLINSSSSLSCEACTTSRPVKLVTTKDGWFCEFCGSGPREMGFWSCADCGWVRKWG